jgi:hypothetical protein
MLGQKRSGIRVWLTAKQAKLIWPGLDRVVSNLITYQEKGTTRNSASYRLAPIRGYDNGDWNQELLNKLLAIYKRLGSRCQSDGYVRMDFIDLRMAAFGARTHVHVVRQLAEIAVKWDQRTQEKFSWDLNSIRTLATQTKAVIRSLERRTKRANRLFMQEHTESEFREKAHEWQRFLRWLHYHLAFFGKEHPPEPSLRKYYLARIDYLIGIASSLLSCNGYQLPAPQDLRQVVRLYIRYSRRARFGQYGHDRLLRSPEEFIARLRFLEFLERHLTLMETK